MRLVALSLLLCLSFSTFAETLDEFDARIEKQLTDNSVLMRWKEANAARAAEKHEDAAALYADVFRRAPSFVHALRRQAMEELQLGKRDLALTHMREAVRLERSAENLSALAAVLVNTESLSSQEISEAKNLANEATALKPDGVSEHMTLARVAAVSNDLDMLRKAVDRLEEIAPKDPQTQMLRAIVAASDGAWDASRAALDLARANGLSEAQYASVLENIESSRPFYLRWWKPAVLALVVWFGVFGFLLLAGVVLSGMAMRAARSAPTDLASNATAISGRVRRLYAIVLSLSCAFYYASIPLVILSVIALGGGLIYAFFAIGRIPIKLVVIIAALAGISVWSMLKSLFIRRSDEDPGMRLDLSAEPKLRAMLDDVAARIGTRAVDNVYLTPSTDLAVMERGKGRNKERCLILGIAALDGMKLRPFKAVLGHEYGHFSNRDTAGGAFALAVRNSLTATAIGLAQGGAATWYNPAWWFVNGFHRVFLRISEGASRLQEVLADRWAVFAYGASAFEEGLRHVITRSVHFDAHATSTLKEVVDGQLPLTNLYTYQPKKGTDLTEAVEEALQRTSSAYDSHPAPAERFALVHALPQKDLQPEPEDDAPATSLFENLESLQFAMTAQVRENVRANYGVVIATA